MSCAVGDNGVRGGRRSPYVPLSSCTRNTSFDFDGSGGKTLALHPGGEAIGVDERRLIHDFEFFMIQNGVQLRTYSDRTTAGNLQREIIVSLVRLLPAWLHA